MEARNKSDNEERHPRHENVVIGGELDTAGAVAVSEISNLSTEHTHCEELARLSGKPGQALFSSPEREEAHAKIYDGNRHTLLFSSEEEFSWVFSDLGRAEEAYLLAQVPHTPQHLRPTCRSGETRT